MLDDLKYIHQRDSQDALGIAEKQWQQLQHDFEPVGIKGDFQNVLYSGMGGSALAALLTRTWPGYSLPFEVSRRYDIPSWASEKTLFIASSYSGNTEETLEALSAAEQKGVKVAVIAGGGKLADIAKEKNYPILLLPQVGQPRYAVFYSLKALVTLLQSAGLLQAVDAVNELAKAAEFVRDSAAPWLPTVAQKDNPAKKLANELAGKSIVLYAGPQMSPAAYKWKISFNENSKNIAWASEVPELNHNEISGWIGRPIEKPYAVVELRSSLEHPRILRRFEVMEKLLSGQRPAPEIVEVQGSNLLEQLLWTVVFGDFVSIYLALVNGINPTPVELQEKFKLELNQ